MVDCTPTFQDLWIAGQFWDAIICPFSETMGLAVFALLVYAAIGGALWYVSENAILPLVLTMVLGGVVVTQLPGPAVQLVGVFGLLLMAAMGYFLITSRGPARK